MSLPTLLMTHGCGQAWVIGPDLAQEWERAVKFGLQRVGAPYAGEIRVRMAFYGDLWRPDGSIGDRASSDQEPTALQAAVARAILPTDAGPYDADQPTMTRLAANLAGGLGVDRLVVEWFLKDLDQYLTNRTIRDETNERLFKEAAGIDTDIVLLGHSMGSIVAYLSLIEGRPELESVRGFVTFGSPLGLPDIYHHVGMIAPGTPYPRQPRRWVNVFNRADFATAIPRLAGLFKAVGGRAVEDVESVGRWPAAGNPGVGHDPRIYLSSRRLAQELRNMIESYWPEAAAGPADAVPAPAAVLATARGS